MANDENWFAQGYRTTLANLVDEVGISAEEARNAYSFLQSRGFIDYDVEKELFYAMVEGEEE